MCKLCGAGSKKLKQNLSKGYTSCIAHVKGRHSEGWEQALESALEQQKTKGGDHMERTVTRKAINIHKWLEWVIMGDQPFSFVENSFTRKNTKIWSRFTYNSDEVS